MSSSQRPRLRQFRDRVRQVVLFEIAGLLFVTPPFVWISGFPPAQSIGLLALIALIAALWNGAYNTAFDWIEARLSGGRADLRSWPLRAVHALGFEAGLLLVSLPVIVAWTGVTLGTALIADAGLAVAYAILALLFNLVYDRVFPIDEVHGDDDGEGNYNA